MIFSTDKGVQDSAQVDTISRLEFTFDKVTLISGQAFRLYLYEQGGTRHYVLTFGIKDIGRTERI